MFGIVLGCCGVWFVGDLLIGVWVNSVDHFVLLCCIGFPYICVTLVCGVL